MSKIEEVVYAESCKLSQYDDILYNLNFIEDILDVKPENVWISDESRMHHFGCDVKQLKHKLFYKYGYELRYTREKLINVLKRIKSNILEAQPADLHSFWAVPSRLCISHSHPARDVFSQENLVNNILAHEFDIIIELRTHKREPNAYNINLFDNYNDMQDNYCRRYEDIIPDNEMLSYDKIKEIVDVVDYYLQNDAKILLHSQGRTDRLALILACWLIKNKLADDTNFIDKIASLRHGLWAKGDDSNILDQYDTVKLNKTLYWIADETCPYIPNVKNKIKKMMTVPFLFSKELIEKTKYWEFGKLPVDYDVDYDILTLIKKFKPVDEKMTKKKAKINDVMQIHLNHKERKVKMNKYDNFYSENFNIDESNTAEAKLVAIAEEVISQSEKLIESQNNKEIRFVAAMKTEENKFRLTFILENCKVISPMFIELTDDIITIFSSSYKYDEDGMSESSIPKAIEVYNSIQRVLLMHKQIVKKSTAMTIKIEPEAKTWAAISLIRELLEEIIS